MLPSTPLFSNRLGRSFAAFAVTAGFLLVACSSDDAANNPGGAGSVATAGTAGSSAGTPGTAGGGATTTAGSGGTSVSGAGQAGTPTGGAGANTGGTAGANAGGGAGGSGGNTGGTAGSGGSAGMSNAPFTLTSTAFKDKAEIPLKYKCANVNPMGENQSPPLSWGPGPAGTKSYAVVLMHLPNPEHWVIWDIPAAITSLPENIEHKAQPAAPAGSKQSLANLDGFQGSGYLGPCPQAVNSPQTYQFTLYALDVDTVPGLTATSTPTEAATAVKAHLVAGSQGQSLSGTQVRTN